ncbi:MAG: type I-E CRISPR-associated protein Cse1/CasA [Desulfobacterales bacterium]|nr:MAG: type I-E CRISPR-associated protein Cse1/CasA [Desulfobacterales bacterium]
MNLLMDEVFRVVLANKIVRRSLPGLLQALGQDQVDALAGVQRHQADIFHIFLCYLAGSVLVESGRGDPNQPSEFWIDGLRALAGRNDDCAWELVVEDPTKPAFMQPPAPSKQIFETDYKPKAETPDSLDVLQSAKNHDLKATRARKSDIEAWVLALIGHQTASGFLGQGKFGIARMNGGFGSRVCVGWKANSRSGMRFHRDVKVLLAHRKTLLKAPYPYVDGGLTCLWIEPWDGKTGLSLSQLDPFFIEVARRIRLVDCGSIVALGTTSKTTRIAAQALKGNVGDPWTPIKVSSSSALTPSANGFHPGLLRNLIFQDDYELSPVQIPTSNEGSGWFCASSLVRGQGTTDGFREASIRVPARVQPILFGGGNARDRLAELSKIGLEMAAGVQNKCLRPALYALMEGGPDSVNFGKREISVWVGSQSRSFLTAWQPLYFDWLWTTLDAEDDVAALRPWVQNLKGLARDVLEKAFRSCPSRNGRGYRAISLANGIFFGGLYKNFADYMEEKNDGH